MNRRALLLLAILAASVLAFMPSAAHATGPSQVQASTTHISGTSTMTCSLSSTVTAGDVLILSFNDPSSDTYTVSDSLGSTGFGSAQLNIGIDGGIYGYLFIYTALVTTTGSSDTITVSISQNTYASAECAEFKGLTSATPIATGTGTGSITSGISYTTSVSLTTISGSFVYAASSISTCGALGSISAVSLQAISGYVGYFGLTNTNCESSYGFSMGTSAGGYTANSMSNPSPGFAVTSAEAVTENTLYWSAAAIVLPQAATTVSYSVSGGGSPTAPVFNYYIEGVLTHYTLTTTPTAKSIDPSSAWTITPNPLTGSGIHEQWATNSPISGTATSALTLAPIYYNQYQGNFSESFSGGTRTVTNGITLTYTQFGNPATATLTSSYQNFWIDYGGSWSVPNPGYSNFVAYTPSPISGTMTGKLQQNIAFGASNTCTGGNPLTIYEQGCILPAVIATLSAPVGVQIWFGFIILGLNVGLYNKNQNIWMSLVVLWCAGAAFGFLIPSSAATIAQIFLYIGCAGALLKLLFRFW